MESLGVVADMPDDPLASAVRRQSGRPIAATVYSMSEESPCLAVVVTCIDYRFSRCLAVYLRRVGLHGLADVIGWPGGGAILAAADGDVVWDALSLSMRLHHPLEVILVAHEDCGRFQQSSVGTSVVNLDALLQAAMQRTKARFPHAKVRSIVLQMNGSARNVDVAP